MQDVRRAITETYQMDRGKSDHHATLQTADGSGYSTAC